MTIAQALRKVQKSLKSLPDIPYISESELILESLTGLDRHNLYRYGTEALDSIAEAKLASIIRRRLTEEPLSYILGTAYFHSQKFKITPSVLIPRPDTEILVETILEGEQKDRAFFIDMGTGSGAIAATLLRSRPHWNAVISDISFDVLHIAIQNTGSRATPVCSDMLKAFSMKFSFIVSNPPYIAEQDIKTLDVSVQKFEPFQALCGGEDGLYFYRYLAAEGSNYLIPGGSVYYEIGFDQEERVRQIFLSHGWQNIRIINDFGQRPRVICAQNPQ